MDSTATDQAILSEFGRNLQRTRLSRNLSQARLAEEAGVGRDTIRRLEAGEPVSSLTLVRVFRALGMVQAFEELTRVGGPGPLEQLERGPRGRRRARASAVGRPGSEWRWGEEDEG